ncbi:hypothetical protein LCGC14_2239670 [marine sediment metagenome]|uniref:Uncharacterized protein n=1 Tax=marine sediment metagenome TaxID=412755 RepID=A0A0F9D601_9ZZZZ
MKLKQPMNTLSVWHSGGEWFVNVVEDSPDEQRFFATRVSAGRSEISALRAASRRFGRLQRDLDRRVAKLASEEKS